MANFTPSPLISEIRGSVGNLTYSRNRGGAVVKQKLVQVNPNTIDQQAVRAAMADAIAEWQNLDQTQQNLWMNYVNTQLVGKNISRKIRRSAMNEFVSRWMNRFAVGGVAVEFKPLPKVRINPVILSVEQAPSSLTINIDTLRSVGNCDVVVYATHPLSPGINMINTSFYRIIGVFSPAARLTSVDIFADYVAKFPLTVGDVGKKIGIAIRAINTDNYAAGSFFFVQTIISGGMVSNGVLLQLFNADYYNNDLQSFIKRAAVSDSRMNTTRGKLWMFYRY